MYLYTKVCHSNTNITAKGLSNRSKKSGACPPISIARSLGHINRNSASNPNRAGSKDLRLHFCQHAPYICVVNNCTSAVCDHRATLLTAHRVSQSMLICAFCNTNPLHTNCQPSIVHHGEHTSHSVVFLAYKPSLSTREFHYCSWTTMDAQFMLKAHAAKIIANA